MSPSDDGDDTSFFAGFNINSSVLQAIVNRYADAQYAIDFDSFVGCLIKLEMLFSKSHQTQKQPFVRLILTGMIQQLHAHIKSVSFSPAHPEMFKLLEVGDSGKIELDIQKVWIN